jgi:hypothetical protein
MRGTSRREDAAFWVVQLCEPSTGSDGNGLKFISQFSKNRDGTAEETQTFEWTFETCANGKIVVSHRRLSALDELRQWLRDGVNSCADLADGNIEAPNQQAGSEGHQGGMAEEEWP